MENFLFSSKLQNKSTPKNTCFQRKEQAFNFLKIFCRHDCIDNSNFWVGLFRMQWKCPHEYDGRVCRAVSRSCDKWPNKFTRKNWCPEICSICGRLGRILPARAGLFRIEKNVAATCHHQLPPNPAESHRGKILNAVAGTPGTSQERTYSGQTSGTLPKPHNRPPSHSFFTKWREFFEPCHAV